MFFFRKKLNLYDMPRIKCPKCQKAETILKSGFIRKKQRFYCKECNYNFTLHHEGRKAVSNSLKSHQTTIADIANAMGVSVSTVSRALHDHPDISPERKSSIKQLAQSLEYQPNALAQSLASRTTHTIGVIIPDIERPFFASVVSGIQHKASASGYKVIICQSNESHNTEVANVQTLMNNMIDGLLICHSKETTSFDHLKLHLRRGIPIIHFDRVCEEMATSKIYVDDVNGSFLTTNHLLKEGYKRIAVLAGPKHLTISKNRVAGYKKALKKNGIRFDEALLYHGDFSMEETKRLVNQMLQSNPKPDAIFSVFHKGAIDAMMHLKTKKIKIPQQIGVAAFGNDSSALIIEPSLTAFDQQPFHIGEMAVKEFLEQIIDSASYQQKSIVIKGSLIVRDSTRRTLPTPKKV